jgi:hypothetical protein
MPKVNKIENNNGGWGKNKQKRFTVSGSQPAPEGFNPGVQGFKRHIAVVLRFTCYVLSQDKW